MNNVLVSLINLKPSFSKIDSQAHRKFPIKLVGGSKFFPPDIFQNPPRTQPTSDICPSHPELASCCRVSCTWECPSISGRSLVQHLFPISSSLPPDSLLKSSPNPPHFLLKVSWNPPGFLVSKKLVRTFFSTRFQSAVRTNSQICSTCDTILIL